MWNFNACTHRLVCLHDGKAVTSNRRPNWQGPIQVMSDARDQAERDRETRNKLFFSRTTAPPPKSAAFTPRSTPRSHSHLNTPRSTAAGPAAPNFAIPLFAGDIKSLHKRRRVEKTRSDLMSPAKRGILHPSAVIIIVCPVIARMTGLEVKLVGSSIISY